MSEEPTDLVPVEVVELGMLKAHEPRGMIQSASDMANALADVIEQKGLASNIKGKHYVRVEGWTTLLAMLGIVAREVDITEDNGTFTATVELVKINDGSVIGRASAECGMDEARWSKMPRYARRSMAATRATGKAARLSFAWVMALAGKYETTPAEEMSFDDNAAVLVEEHESPEPPLKAYTLGDEYTPPPVGMNPGDVTIHFGPDAGSPLSEMEMWKLDWHYVNACEKINANSANDADKQLHAALIKFYEQQNAELPDGDQYERLATKPGRNGESLRDRARKYGR